MAITELNSKIRELLEKHELEVLYVEGDYYAAQTVKMPVEDYPFIDIYGFLIDFNHEVTSDRVIQNQIEDIIKRKIYRNIRFSSQCKWIHYSRV